jgi:toxin ParE1/3/4
MHNIHIHVLAKTDIQQLWRSSSQQWGEAQTQVYIDQLEQAILTLQENPHIGIVCDEIREGYGKYHINRHMVFYRVTPKKIVIVRVLHDRMDFTQHL